MANVFAILSAIALAAAAFLAMKNKDAYETEIGERHKAEDKLAKSTARFEALTEDFNQTEKDRKETEAAVASLTGQESGQKKKVQTITAELDGKKKESDTNAAKISEIEKKLEGTGNLKDLVVEIKAVSEELDTLRNQIGSNTAILADLVHEKGRTEGVIGTYRDKNSNFANKVSYFSSARISAIYPAYGFVTLPVGSTSGVVPGSTLNVVRDDTVVAKLRVRSVETGRAAAEIIPDSQVADTTLMVGDRVVPSKEAAPAKSTHTPAPATGHTPAKPAAPAAGGSTAPTIPTEATPAPESGTDAGATPAAKEEPADPFAPSN